MSTAYFMGIDTGTNSSKGVIINDSGEVIAQHATEHEMTNPLPGHYEHDAEQDWWGDFCLISNALIEKAQIDPGDIRAVGISALGADCLPVDEHCRPLRKAILYGIDSRAMEECQILTEKYGSDQITRWFGRPLGSSDVMPKILWIKRHEPEIWSKTHKFLTGSSFISAKLTGNYTVDRFLGLASFNPLYDQVTWKPVPELCAPVCRPDQLAEIHEATDIAGYVTDEAAEQTGLVAGTPVIVGTDDSGAEAISAGVVEPGKMMLQFGSSIYMILATEDLVDDERLWREQFIVPGTCDISAGTNTAGSLTKWFRDNIFEDAVQMQDDGVIDAYETMMAGVEEIEPGSDNLVTLPYFAGERTPVNDPLAKGVIFGLTMAHTRAHLYRSALEGIGYSVNQQLRIMAEHDVPMEQIFVVGGGAKNQVWMQIVADITGRELSSPAITVGAAFGDALMAALGVHHPGFEDFSALTQHIKSGNSYRPNLENHRKYIKFQQVYDDLYPATKELAHRLH